MKVEIRHIGVMPVCGIDPDALHIDGSTDREDLGYKGYLQYQRHPFRGEKFLYCKRCLAVIKAREKRFA